MVLVTGFDSVLRCFHTINKTNSNDASKSHDETTQFTVYPPGEGHMVWLGNLLWNKWLAPQNN